MRTFFAVQGSRAISGSFSQCLNWGVAFVRQHPEAIIKILTARPEDQNAKVIYEIANQEIIQIHNGRLFSLKRIKKALDNG